MLDNHDPNNGSVWYLEGSHRLGRLPIEVDEERIGSNPKNWRNERGKPCVLPDDHNFPHIDGYLRKGQLPYFIQMLFMVQNQITQIDLESVLTGYIKEGSNFDSKVII